MTNVIDFNTSQPVDFDKVNVVEKVYVTRDEIERVNGLLKNAKIIAEYEYKKSRRFISVEQGYYLLGYICGIAVAELL